MKIIEKEHKDFYGFDLFHFDELDSTNLYAYEVLSHLDKNSRPVIIVADQQKAGKGRYGNDWISPQGNLYCSLIIRPDINLADFGKISFVTSLALHKTLRTFLPDTDIAIKWPNDILIDQRAKISGILMEAEKEFLIIGIGVNLHNAPKLPDRITTALIEHIKERPINNLSFLSIFLPVFLELYQDLLKNGFHKIRENILPLLAGLGENIEVRLPHERLTGKFEAFDENGCLILRDEYGKTRAISAGEVFLS